MMAFHYHDSSGKDRIGEIRMINENEPLEMEIHANGWTFHAITGKHAYGNYICIPNWNVGSELAYLRDEFWNSERLRNCTSLKEENALAVAGVLAAVDKWLMEYRREECG